MPLSKSYQRNLYFVGFGDWRYSLINPLESLETKLQESNALYAADHISAFPVLQDIAQDTNYIGTYKGGFPAHKSRELCRAAIKTADIVFFWQETEVLPESVLFELGVAEGLGKFTRVGLADGVAVNHLDGLIRVSKGDIVSCFDSVLYQAGQAGIGDWVMMTSKYVGRCSRCRGSFKPGDSIMWAKGRGSLHYDCYAQVDPAQAVVEHAFSAAVIEALRLQNSVLEKENTTLIGRNASLNRRLQQLEGVSLPKPPIV